MLDTANTYDDKVAVIHVIVSDEAGRFKRVQGNDVKGYQLITAAEGADGVKKPLPPPARVKVTEGDKNGSAGENTGTENESVFDQLTGTRNVYFDDADWRDEASEILRNLSPREVQHLGTTMYSVQGLDQETVNLVLDEFLAIIKAQTSLNGG